jgi:hypothetical protein
MAVPYRALHVASPFDPFVSGFVELGWNVPQSRAAELIASDPSSERHDNKAGT